MKFSYQRKRSLLDFKSIENLHEIFSIYETEVSIVDFSSVENLHEIFFLKKREVPFSERKGYTAVKNA